MKRLLMVVVTAALLLAAVAVSQNPATKQASVVSDLQIAQGLRNPWSHLRLNNDPNEFRFAVVSDRTGGHRAKIFSRAVDRLNLMQPEFVISVGDLIEGYKEDTGKLNDEWREFQGYVNKLSMPFFYVPGNHDLATPVQGKLWQEKFGPTYYHFVYRNVLFLMINSSDPTGKVPQLSPEQIAAVKKVLAENENVRWTIVALHHPLWNDKDSDKNGWPEVEKALADRPYTVFAGHIHHYRKFVRNGQNYYQLATTGGGSRMRGVRYGEFDHIVWVTMKKDGPLLANVMLDGILPEDLRVPGSDEEGVPTNNRKPTQPVRGKVYFDGAALPEGMVAFHFVNPDKKVTKTADAMLEADGSFLLSTYTASDGAPIGEYIVTVSGTGSFGVPARYGKTDTSDLLVNVKTGTNDFTLELKK